MANFQLGSSANSRCGGASFKSARALFLAVLPGTFVKELAFGKAVLFLNARFADGVFDRDFTLDGLRVNEHLAAHGFGVFGEHFEAEVVHACGAEAGEQFEGRLWFAHKERVAAFGVALQKVAFALVVQNFHLVLGANLATFGEAAARGKRAGEGSIPNGRRACTGAA